MRQLLGNSSSLKLAHKGPGGHSGTLIEVAEGFQIVLYCISDRRKISPLNRSSQDMAGLVSMV